MADASLVVDHHHSGRDTLLGREQVAYSAHGRPQVHRRGTQARRGSGHAIAAPFDVKAEFGAARPRVRVTLDDHAPFTTTVAAYSGRGWIGLRKAQLAEFGLVAGDSVRVTLDPA